MQIRKLFLLTVALVCVTLSALASNTAGWSTPGTTNYANGGMQWVGSEAATEESTFRDALLDLEHGYAYFTTNFPSTNATFVKVALGDGNDPPHRVDNLILGHEVLSPQAAVIDTLHGYAYIGWGNMIDKIALGDGDAAPRKISSVSILLPYGHFTRGVIDSENGYLCLSFSRGSTSGIAKVSTGGGDALPTVLEILELPEVDYHVGAGIDVARGYAYFVSYDHDSTFTLTKVALGMGDAAPTLIGVAHLPHDDGNASAGAFDTENGYAYICTGRTGGVGSLVEFSLGEGNEAPSRVGAINATNEEGAFELPLLDPIHGYGYFFTGKTPGIAKYALGDGNVLPTRVGDVPASSLTVNGYFSPECGVIDPQNGHAFYGLLYAGYLKVSLGSGDDLPAFVGQERGIFDEDKYTCGVIDAQHGYGYFGTDDKVAVVKMKLGEDDNPPHRVGSVPVPPEDNYPFQEANPFQEALMDSTRGRAYFISGTQMATYSLGDNDDPPTRLGAYDLLGYSVGITGVIDEENGYAYVFHGLRLRKFDLNTTDTIPPVVSDLLVSLLPETGVIDQQNGYAYFGTEDRPAHILKIALGEGNAAPVLLGDLKLEEGEDRLTVSVIDTSHGFLLAAGDSDKIIKVSLGEGNDPPTRIGAISTGGYDFTTAVRDTESGFAYFTNETSILKIDGGDHDDLPKILGTTTTVIDYQEGEIVASGIDAAKGFLYTATGRTSFSDLGAVTKIALNQTERGYLRGSRFTLTEIADPVKEVRFYSHEATGNVRLALYANGNEYDSLLWQSGVIPNTATNGFLVAPISGGTPSSLALSPGIYWATWQVDTDASVPSSTSMNQYSFGAMQPFGEAPSFLTFTDLQYNHTRETWTEFITYGDFDTHSDLWTFN